MVICIYNAKDSELNSVATQINIHISHWEVVCRREAKLRKQIPSFGLVSIMVQWPQDLSPPSLCSNGFTLGKSSWVGQ